MGNKYECKRRSLMAGYTCESEEYHVWKDISAELIETIIGVMTPLTEIIGYFDPGRTTEHLEQELAEGNVIELNNFYVRKKVSA